MKWIDTYHQAPQPEFNQPAFFRFVFSEVNERGEYTILSMPDSGQWPLSAFLYGEYHPNEPFDNDHLGNQICLIGEVILDRLFTRVAY
jgi:hypothetical protein